MELGPTGSEESARGAEGKCNPSMQSCQARPGAAVEDSNELGRAGLGGQMTNQRSHSHCHQQVSKQPPSLSGSGGLESGNPRVQAEAVDEDQALDQTTSRRPQAPLHSQPTNQLNAASPAAPGCSQGWPLLLN